MSVKVLHVLDHSLPKTDGYSIRSLNIIRFQPLFGIEPVVLTSPAHPQGSGDIDVIEGARHYRTQKSPLSKFQFLGHIDAMRQMRARIDQLVDIERPNIIHAHSPCLWGAAAAWVARRRALPLVYEIRGLWEDAAVDQGMTSQHSPRYQLTRWLETRIAQRATVVAVISEHLRAELLQRRVNADRVFVVPNGVDTEKFKVRDPDEQLKRTLGLADQLCIGYVGTLYPWEGVEDLVRAVPRILEHVPRLRVLIVGGGVEESSLQNIITERNLGTHVTLVGNVPHEEVLRYYSVMDVLVYPRKRTRNTELTTPLKPLEAMAARKAVVGSDVGGIQELMASGAGVFYRADDPTDLARTCVKLLTNPEARTRLGQKAQEYVKAKRDWRVVVQSYVQIYSQALNGPSSLSFVESGLVENTAVGTTF